MLNRIRLKPTFLATAGAVAASLLLPIKPAVASPDQAGPCAGRLQTLGYRQVELDGRQAHVSMYEARRGSEEVKLIVHNSNCAVKDVWLDE